MASFADTAFDKSAFSVDAFDFGSSQQIIEEPARGRVLGLGGAGPYDRGRTKKEREADRLRFGIQAPVIEIIEAIAERQAERLETDEQKRFEELERELQLRGVEWEARFLERLNQARTRLIDAEIGKLLRQQIEDEQIMLMLLAASI